MQITNIFAYTNHIPAIKLACGDDTVRTSIFTIAAQLALHLCRSTALCFKEIRLCRLLQEDFFFKLHNTAESSSLQALGTRCCRKCQKDSLHGRTGPFSERSDSIRVSANFGDVSTVKTTTTSTKQLAALDINKKCPPPSSITCHRRGGTMPITSAISSRKAALTSMMKGTEPS